MRGPVARRRGWVAEAPADAPSLPLHEMPAFRDEEANIDPPAMSAFAKQEDGSWVAAIPAPVGVTTAKGVALDIGERQVQVAFPEEQPYTLLLPPGTSQAQVDACAARFSKRRCELVLTVPAPSSPADAAAGPPIAAQTSEVQPSITKTVAEPPKSEPAPGAAACVGKKKPSKPVKPNLPVDEEEDAEFKKNQQIMDARVKRLTETFFSEKSDGSAAAGRWKSSEDKDRTMTLQEQEQSEALDIAGALMLHAAASTADIARLKALLNAKVNPDSQDETGATPLEKACLAASVNAVEVLLQYGASARGMEDSRSRPLHRAASIGNTAVRDRLLRLLHARGADPKQKDEAGRTAADIIRAAGAQVPRDIL
eukprot:gnl/TRDRNA2_/TRDRNA2_37780_c0_seq1.p1 gnl/TRDRNA2_/TRDRNA2_37780_c0~~gnl/TRDRNA2_/TRDRNA2_37780_c0_seq1.p1  ORF type:complete len:406 (+),score=96.42 gnl/TRDRNA2_/TRDRNA2_37780_c0_seq1:117-1220(+)